MYVWLLEARITYENTLDDGSIGKVDTIVCGDIDSVYAQLQGYYGEHSSPYYGDSGKLPHVGDRDMFRPWFAHHRTPMGDKVVLCVRLRKLHTA